MNAESYTPIATLENGKTYEQVFLVSNVESHAKMRTKQGKAFARLTFKDVTGEISGVMWDFGEECPIVPGSYVTAKIETKSYRESLEFQLQGFNVQEADTPLNKFDYVKGVSDSVLLSYANEIEEELMSMQDSIYLDVMGNALHRLDFMQALKESPYGITGPMSYKGGLLVHVAHSMRLIKVAIGQAIEQEIPFSPSLVIAGCALRNIGWHTTTQFQGDHLRPRDAFQMIGIYRASARYIDHLMLTCESDLEITIPEAKRQALENMCNKQADISTVEGKIVACADNMADVLDFSVASLQKKQRGNWSDELFVGHLP